MSSTTVPLPSSFQASSAPSPLRHTTYLSIFICCTRNCCFYVIFLLECIACHSRHLVYLPLSYCGTPTQSNWFTLHCHPRYCVFWQCTTYWYRKNRFINMDTGT